MTDDIPDSAAEMLTDDELANVRNRDGWAIGTVALRKDGDITRRIEDAVIELFNGDGTAGSFGGTRFLAEDDGELQEAYAHGTSEAAQANSNEPYWFVEEYTDPDDPDVGKPSP